jgi:GNAT superfamily N-acetyltransferase
VFQASALREVARRRGQGTGAALLGAVHRHLRELGVTEYGLSVMDGNHGALRFYERHGLQPYTHFLIGEVPAG